MIAKIVDQLIGRPEIENCPQLRFSTKQKEYAFLQKFKFVLSKHLFRLSKRGWIIPFVHGAHKLS